MVQFRTGLALESVEEVTADGGRLPDGVRQQERQFSAGKVSRVDIYNTEGARALGREMGRYVTIELEKVHEIQDDDFFSVVDEIAKEVAALCALEAEDSVLVAALGNENITPDALGPRCLDSLLVTRQLQKVDPDRLGHNKLRSVAGIATNVFGTTGIESAEIIEGIADKISPRVIVAVDALATTHLSRLCKTIQISDTGIAPGGGVHNERPTIQHTKEQTRIISIGMPTIIDANTLLGQWMERVAPEGDMGEIEKILSPYEHSLIAMPSQMESAIVAGARLIAFSLNRALHYNMDVSTMLKYLS